MYCFSIFRFYINLVFSFIRTWQPYKNLLVCAIKLELFLGSVCVTIIKYTMETSTLWNESITENAVQNRKKSNHIPYRAKLWFRIYTPAFPTKCQCQNSFRPFLAVVVISQVFSEKYLQTLSISKCQFFRFLTPHQLMVWNLNPTQPRIFGSVCYFGLSFTHCLFFFFSYVLFLFNV